MHPILEILAALLCAVGLLTLGWYLFGRLIATPGGYGGQVYAVVPALGGGESLEHDVRELLWLRSGGRARFRVVIVDGGLDQEGRAVAAALLDRFPEVELCPAERLGDYIRGWEKLGS